MTRVDTQKLASALTKLKRCVLFIFSLSVLLGGHGLSIVARMFSLLFREAGHRKVSNPRGGGEGGGGESL